MRSVKNKIHHLFNLLENQHCDILCMSETWLNTNDVIPIPKNFNMYRSDRVVGRGGGVAVLCKNNFKAKIINLEPIISNFSHPCSLELIALSFQMSYLKSFIVCCIYRTEHVNNDIRNLDIIFEHFSRSNKNVYVYGDFNINVAKRGKVSNKLLCVAQKNGFKQLVKSHTRDTTTIDLFFAKSNDSTLVDTAVINMSISDHSLVT